jgi:hypothetical protein
LVPYFKRGVAVIGKKAGTFLRNIGFYNPCSTIFRWKRDCTSWTSKDIRFLQVLVSTNLAPK